MFGLTEQRVNIGINTLADAHTRHGVLHVVIDNEDGTTTKGLVPLILDKPHLVANGLNFWTWRRLQRQVQKMGIKATHMELKGPKHHFNFSLTEYKELYSTKDKSQPHYRVMHA